ncbi:malate:quinone oxidoreductase [Staphylococcus simulans]|uniref:malate:quinone oxidoreductase n=1 Tax=Staphylococcus simulans TaxID=1286 RepID=UPI002D77F067|nr:malate:quinone oxidoreductase [Staphylococcus simulans]
MSSQHSKTDVILIGGGIMSATLGTLLKKVAPEKEIKVFEKLDASAQESSNAWNNAGTGHSALCEMNYTKEMPDGSLDISKALKINEQFQVSKEFWSYLVKHGNLTQPEAFIHTVPHMSFCIGVRNVDFLRRRVKALKENALFNEMTMTEDKNQIEKWLPLMMEGRNNNIPVAVSRDETGTDVNFGALTQKLFDFLQQNQVDVEYEHQVTDLKQRKDGTWKVKVKDLKTEETTTYITDFVFIGAGGASLPLLQKNTSARIETYRWIPSQRFILSLPRS